MFISEKNLIVTALKGIKTAIPIATDIEDVIFTLDIAAENSNLNESEDPDVEILASMVNSIMNSPSLPKIEAAILWAESIEVYEDEEKDEDEEED